MNPVHSIPVVAKKWPYAAPIAIRPSTQLQRVSSGPELSQVGSGLQEKIHHGVSYFEVGAAEFERAVSLPQQAKAIEDSKIRQGVPL